jgi:hypothetical protein
MPHEVRPHTRRTASGKTASVRRHTRTGDGADERPEKLKRKRGPNPGHAGKLAKRAAGHGKRGRKVKAGAFALLAAGELVAFLTLGGTSLLLALVAGVLAAISVGLTA